MDLLWEPAGRLVNGPRVNTLKLETERLFLRGFSQDDLRDVVDWHDDSNSRAAETAAREFLDFCFRQYERPGMGPWGIVLKETGRVIGNCGYIGLRQFCGEVNCFVAPQLRERGFASEALGALLNFGFTDLDLVRIQARCEPDNLISQRLAQKIGMKLNEAPPRVPVDDRSRDQKMFAILR
jgi:ribosomal-protein-alanine N-acetyltransferase